MKWLKAALVGALGSFVMFVLMLLGIHLTGIAPFNTPPSAAFLKQLGFAVGPLPLVIHFGYGATWSMVLVALWGGDTDLKAGLTLAGALWLFMMVVYSPIIGWGFFGFGGTGHTLASTDPLYLGSPVKYIVATLVLHLIYGSIIGGLNPYWLRVGSTAQASA
jgi:hypothetical protein